MKRVFTDKRFPGFEVHNSGTSTFHVYERMTNGQLQEIDTFSTYSSHPDARINPYMAQKRAEAYFDRMANGKMSDELNNRGDTMELPGNPDRDHTENFTSHGPMSPTGKNASLDDLMGTNVLTADDVMSAWDQAKAMKDPEQQRRAMQQVQQMSSNLESAAQELVRRLID